MAVASARILRTVKINRAKWAVLDGLRWSSARERADYLSEKILLNYRRNAVWQLSRRIIQPQRDYGRGEVLVQLADETVVATSFVVGEILIRFVMDLRGRAGGPGDRAAMPVRGFDGGAVQDKENQQQTEPAREACVWISHQSKHAGP